MNPTEENITETTHSTITNFLNNDDLMVNPGWYEDDRKLHGSIDIVNENNSLIHSLPKLPDNKHTKFE